MTANHGIERTTVLIMTSTFLLLPQLMLSRAGRDGSLERTNTRIVGGVARNSTLYRGQERDRSRSNTRGNAIGRRFDRFQSP